MSRPEAAGILEKFAPISKAIRRGNLCAFKKALGPEGGNERWFFQKGILLPMLYRCEALVWRSLSRKVFILTYHPTASSNPRAAATLEIRDLVTAAQLCQRMLEGWQRPIDSMTAMQNGRAHPNAMFNKSPELAPPAHATPLYAERGVIFANHEPDLHNVEAIIASLVQQGLLHGFVSHSQARFAILGAKQMGGPLNAGWPCPWEVIKGRAEGDVPGWVQEERKIGVGGVVNLSGIARPVGSGM